MKMSDIFDIPLILVDDNGFLYELEFEGYTLEGGSEFPIQCFLKKGKRIFRKNVLNYEG